MTDAEKYEEEFRYLDALRDSGKTNMFGAGAYLQRDFVIGKERAKDILLKWMHWKEEQA